MNVWRRRHLRRLELIAGICVVLVLLAVFLQRVQTVTAASEL